ncbi:MAG: holo-ACP synthase [Porticoccus sp.]|nr:holo-ACP synthase [Porticoccus sp.]|tara:strand:- start:192 stop:572 length:381 start_codon:yes stop_codon:yes gene_type:complete
MIIGIGTDIVQIDRIKCVFERQGHRFVERILCPSEVSIFEKKKQSIAYLAKRFAAKEAASKALGTGVGPISWQDMEISNNSNGAPILLLTGAAKERMELIGAHQISISLSDELDYAVAFVVLSSAL